MAVFASAADGAAFPKRMQSPSVPLRSLARASMSAPDLRCCLPGFSLCSAWCRFLLVQDGADGVADVVGGVGWALEARAKCLGCWCDPEGENGLEGLEVGDRVYAGVGDGIYLWLLKVL